MKHKTRKDLQIRKGKLIKRVLRNCIYVIIGVIAMIYYLLRWFNNLMVSLFMMLPRMLRVSLIYSLIGLSCVGFMKPREVIKTEQPIINVKFAEFQAKEVQEDNLPVQEENEEIRQEKCVLSDVECKIYNRAKELGFTDSETYLAISISKHETGKWTSIAFNKKNNWGGICNSNGIKSYASKEDGLDAFLNLLMNRYFKQGLNTIEQIGKVYCPIGADNDPNGLNKYWVPYVTNYYNEYVK